MIGYSIRLSGHEVNEALKFLLRVGLIEKEGMRFKVSQKSMHLPGDSPLISNHHLNWRFKTAQVISENNIEKLEKNIHYSSVVSISKSDAEVINRQLRQSILKAKEKIKNSKEETLYGFCLDFFSLLL